MGYSSRTGDFRGTIGHLDLDQKVTSSPFPDRTGVKGRFTVSLPPPTGKDMGNQSTSRGTIVGSLVIFFKYILPTGVVVMHE